MKTLISVIILFSFVIYNTAVAQDADPRLSIDSSSDSQSVIPQSAQKLIRAYPDLQLQYRDNHIIFKDGSSMVYDDGEKKDFISMLDNSDIEDMFSMKYPTGQPVYLQDAGRSRCDAFFKKIYGENAQAVKRQLISVPWFGSTVRFTKINGAAEQLGKVAAEIKQNYPHLIPYMKSAGTFYWRKVRGANRQSSHSYGIAIDIAVKQSDYWKWGNPKAKETDEIDYKNRIPMEIVDVFEKHGFVWGGRWYHYDTMHFEYRPEIL